jgi:hypothetical protein
MIPVTARITGPSSPKLEMLLWLWVSRSVRYNPFRSRVAAAGVWPRTIMQRQLSVALIEYGAWGWNIARNLAGLGSLSPSRLRKGRRLSTSPEDAGGF